MMTKLVRLRNLALLVAVAAFLQTFACKSKPAEGPAEKAGRKVDQAAQDTKEEVKKLDDDDADPSKKKP
jgi:hypothetical protein